MGMDLDYGPCLALSERVSWRLGEVLGNAPRLDFDRPFVPVALVVEAESLEFLSRGERRWLNQITGHAYLNLFQFVEEYIIADVMDHGVAARFGDEVRLRVLLRFAEEEVKHQQLFRAFLRLFDAGFGAPCKVLDGAEAVAGVILSKHPVAIMLTTLHLELITQRHYVAYVKDAHGEDRLDPLFVSLLHHHWIEEAQHAKVDQLELAELRTQLGADQRETAVQDYIDILAAFDGLLSAQAQMNVESLATRSGRAFTDEEAARITAAQYAAYRRIFLRMGLDHPTLQEELGHIVPGALARAEARLFGAQGAA